ncbi:MAG: cupin domain-containing protein [Caldilineaceae bacterium]
MDYLVLNQNELSPEGSTVEWEGYHFGDTAGSLILVNLSPGEGPRLHRHPYPEIFVVHEGEANYTVGTTNVAVRAGQIVVVSAGVPHKFINSGPGKLRQTDIHLSAKFVTEWLEN